MRDINEFWNGSLLGLTYTGEGEVNVYGESDCIDNNVPMYIAGNKGKTNTMKNFLHEKGFSVAEVLDADNCENEEVELKKLIERINGNNNYVLFTNRSFYRKYSLLINSEQIRVLIYEYVAMFYNVFLPQLRQVYDLLEDELSRDTYTAVLCQRFKILKRNVLHPYIVPNQYFCIPQQMAINRNETFVDCGAFVGDTLETLIKNRSGIISKIYCFEPFEIAFNALSVRSERLKREWALEDNVINPVKAGTGLKHCYMKIDNSGSNMGSRLIVSENQEEGNIEVVSLDEYFGEERVSFIKADIEGMEIDMINGAQNIIKRDKPNLAICIYHKLTHYYEIPLLLKQLVPEYKMVIRHHSPTIEETVLYCYIDNGL